MSIFSMETDPTGQELASSWSAQKDTQSGAECAGAKPDQPEQSRKEVEGDAEKRIKLIQHQLNARRAKLAEIERKKKRVAAREEIRRLETTIAAMTEQEQSQQKAVRSNNARPKDSGLQPSTSR